jgi:hypothetical protein
VTATLLEDEMDILTPSQVIMRIAQVAMAIGDQAGVGAMETAGMIVSVLAEHPEHVERFMADGVEFMLSGEVLPEKGCLTWHRTSDQKVTTPQELRAVLMVKNMERGRPADFDRGRPTAS